MYIESDLKEVINKSLPQAVGETLRKRLEQADQDAATVIDLNERIATYRKEIAALQATLTQLRTDLDQHGALAIREKAVADRERLAELVELKTQIAAEKGNAEFARSVAMGLVRNTEYRHSVFESSNTPIVKDTGGGYQSIEHPNSTRSVTTEQKVT